MNDLISRQAAIDAINKAFERVFAWDGTSPLGDKVLENVPSAQPEIIRCKDCKHRYMDGDVTHYYWCRLHDRPVDDADYCAWGEESEVKE